MKITKFSIYLLIICIVHIYFNFTNISEIQFNSLHVASLSSVSLFIITKSPLVATIPYIIPGMVAYHEYFDIKEVSISNTIVSILLLLYLLYESTKKNNTTSISIITILSILYILFLGQYLPTPFHFNPVDFVRYCNNFLFSSNGVFGDIVSISSTYLFLFGMYSALLIKSNSLSFLDNISIFISNKVKGGSAYASIFIGSIIGMITGSTVANVITSGSITIPLMIKEGWSKEEAGAIETASSLGSQLMPPVMGAGIFIMSQLTNIPLMTIIACALIPGIMYYIFLFLYIREMSVNKNLSKSNTLFEFKFKETLPFLFSFITLVSMIIFSYSVQISVIGSIIVLILTRLILFGELLYIFDACLYNIKTLIPLMLLLSCASIFVGVFTLAGTFIHISGFLNILPLWMIILATIFINIIFGLGMPASSTYLMTSMICSVPLLNLLLTSEQNILLTSGLVTPEIIGIILSVHMFLFWLSQDSNVSPPVAVASYTASQISEGDANKTAWLAWKYSKGLYFVSILFLFTPLIYGSIIIKLSILFCSIIFFYFVIKAFEKLRVF